MLFMLNQLKKFMWRPEPHRTLKGKEKGNLNIYFMMYLMIFFELGRKAKDIDLTLYKLILFSKIMAKLEMV